MIQIAARLSARNCLSIVSLLSGLLLFVFGRIYNVLQTEYVSFALFAFSILFSDKEQAVYAMFFLLPLDRMLIFTEGKMFYGILCVLLIVRYAFAVRICRVDIASIGLFSVFVLYNVIQFICYYTDKSFFTLAIYFVPLCLVLLMVSNVRFDFKTSADCYILGMLVYLLGSSLLANTPAKPLQLYLEHRFMGINGNANDVAAFIIIGISLIYVVLKNYNYTTKRLGLFFYTFAYFIFVVYGFLTGSRMFVVAFALITVFSFLIMLVRLRQNKLITFLLTAALISVFLFEFNHAYFSKLIDLSLNRFNFTSMDRFTGERSSIISQYLNILFQNRDYLLFGMGIFDYKSISNIGFVTHNIFLEVIIAWGITGSLILYCLIASINKYMKRQCRKMKYELLDYLPLAAFLMCGASISMFYISSIYMYILLCLKAIYDIPDRAIKS